MLAENQRLRQGGKALWTALLAAGSAVTIPACTKAGGGHSGGDGQGQGPIVYVEAEPNNHWVTADFIGAVDPFSHFFIDGFVQTPGGLDTVDYFELYATVPTVLTMYLEGYAPNADLDLCVFDPELGQIVACFESPYNPEVIEIVVHEPDRVFQVFVEAFTVDSEYTIEVVGFPYLLPRAADEDTPAISVRPGSLELPPLEEPTEEPTEEPAARAAERAAEEASEEDLELDGAQRAAARTASLDTAPS